MLNLRETVLDNGLTVLLGESHAAPVVTCWVGYRVGARNERPGITGASHWVEHMTFKGTERLEKGDVFRVTHRHGGSNNGFTTDDFTVYYESLPAAQADVALLIESQRMASARFDPDETESERTVILAEREGSENNPHFLLSELMGEALFTRHPYRNPIIGTRADLERLTREELYGHYRAYYTPSNAVLVVVGDFNADEMLRRVRGHFDAIPSGAPPSDPAPEEPALNGEQRVELRRPGGAPYLHVAYRTPEAGHPDCYPLMVLDAVLSGARGVGWSSGGYMGRTARLYQALVETRIATSAGSGFRLHLDPNALSLSLTLRDGVDPEQAEAALFAAAEGIVERPPDADELSRILRQAEAQFAYSRDGVSSQAFAALYFQLLGHWSDLGRHVERLRAVTPEDVARVAATYLHLGNRVVGWFIPEAGSGATTARHAPSTVAAPAVPPAVHSGSGLDQRDVRPGTPGSRPAGTPGRLLPRREQLDNGLVLLWNRIEETAAVSIRASFPAGAARETLAHAGLAAFTTRLLRRGTRVHTATQIAERVEAIGASFAVWAGAEEAGFSARCLARDVETVLEVLQEILERPAFADGEIAKTRGEILNQLREQEDSSRARADLAAYGHLYPAAHPYSRSSIGTRESVEQLSQDQFRDFHEAFYSADGMKVSIAGDVDPDLLRRNLSRWFPDRKGPVPPLEVPPVPPVAPGRFRIAMPHKSQADLVLVGPGVPRHHPDYFALSIVNLVLGGFGLMGRLGERVRDEQGLAYHVSCRSISRLWSGEWLASAGVHPDNVDRVIEGILAEVERVRREGVTAQELRDAQDYLVGSLPLRMETNDGIAAYMLNCEYYGLGLDYVERYPGYVLAETAGSLREAAVRHMDSAGFTVAVAGPLSGGSA